MYVRECQDASQKLDDIDLETIMRSDGELIGRDYKYRTTLQKKPD